MSNTLQPRRLYVAQQAPLFMRFSRQEYWNVLTCLSEWDLLNLGIRTRISYVSCIGRQILNHWATREILSYP